MLEEEAPEDATWALGLADTALLTNALRLPNTNAAMAAIITIRKVPKRRG
jgi:hypothetical protein